MREDFGKEQVLKGCDGAGVGPDLWQTAKYRDLQKHIFVDFNFQISLISLLFQTNELPKVKKYFSPSCKDIVRKF